MAGDERITQLTRLPEASVAANDPLPIVDVSASETKKVTTQDLFQAGARLAVDGSIDLRLLNQNSTVKLGTAALADDSITAAKLANQSTVGIGGTAPAADNYQGRGWFSSTGNLQFYVGTAYQQVVMPTAGIGDLQVTNAKLAAGAVTTDKVTPLGTAAYADLSVTGAKVADATLAGSKLIANTLTGEQIADGAIGTGELASAAVTYDKIQPTVSGDVLLGRNSSIAGTVEEVACTAAGRALLDDPSADAQRSTLGLGNLAVANGTWADGSSFSGTSSGLNTGDQTITLSGVVNGSGTGSISTTFTPGSVTSADLAEGAIVTGKLGDKSVTAANLADSSSTVVEAGGPVGVGAFIGQLHANSTNGDLTYYTGTGWSDISGLRSLVVNTPDPWVATVSFPFDLNDAQLDITLGSVPLNTVWAGPASGIDGAPTFRLLEGADLPVPLPGVRGGVYAGTGLAVGATGDLNLQAATSTVLGGVSVPAAGGLAVSATGELAHGTTVTAATVSGISFDQNGHITSAVRLAGTDMPLATDEVPGAVVPVAPLLVDQYGSLTHADSGITAGSYAKVVVDAKGHVVGSEPLVVADIPGFDAALITGQLTTTQLAPNSVTASQLADYGIAQVLQQRPKAEFAGQLWINPIDRSAYIWVGVVETETQHENGYWMSLGYGSAIDQNARLGGTYDAANNVVESVNTYGNSAGVVPGQSLPSPAAANNGIYLLVTSVGIGTTPAPVENLSIGDWIFSLGTGTNWIKIGVISGASGIVRDDDVLVEGQNFAPAMANVASQYDANRLIWSYCQVASVDLRGTVKPSSEVLVDPVTEMMSVGVLDEGVF